MNGRKSLVIAILLLFPMITCSFRLHPLIQQVSGTIDGGSVEALNITNIEFDASSASNLPAIVIGDGIVSDIWKDIPSYSNPSYGTNGQIQVVYGKNTIYFLLTYDADITWLAMQWNSGIDPGIIPMQKNADMWVMGSTLQTVVHGDGYSAGQGVPPFIFADKQNDLSYELIPGDKISHVELKRSLTTSDTEGHDIQFELGSVYTLMYASNMFHGFDNQITRQEFELSKNSFGQTTQQSSVSQVTIDQFVFVIKYLNMAIAASIIVLVFVILPIQLIWRKR